MERRSVHLSFEGNEVYEVGAALLVLLSCPVEKSEIRNGDLHASLCALAPWRRYLDDPNNTTPITAKPQYLFREWKRIVRDVSLVDKRLRQRLVASRIAIPFLQQEESGKPPILPAGIKRLSINQLAEFVMEDAEQNDANNVERRYWTPRRPVNRFDGLKIAHPAQPGAPENAADGRRRDAGDLGDMLPGEALAAQRDDFIDQGLRRGLAEPMRARGNVR